MFPRTILKFLSAFLTLFLTGVFLGNLILIYISLIPLLTMILALAFDQPRKIIVKRMEDELTSYVNEVAMFSLRVEIPEGVGLVTIADILPQHFELVEGNNFRIFWKGLGKKAETFSYKIKCTRRGVYWLNSIRWESRHPLAMKQTLMGVNEEPLKLTVKHRPISIKRMRSAKTLSKIPLPLGSSAKLGIATTDFREIRDYFPGDPYRFINWKATARCMFPHKKSLPKVNEFEREGKKVVWIFLDKSPSMALGSSVRNSFEYAVQAATSLARFYLERSCKVGLCIYNGAERIIFPDIGRRQYYKILRELVGVEVEVEEKGNITSLRNAVKKCRGHLIGSNPLSIIVTTITPKNFKQIIEGIKEIRKYTPRIKSSFPQIMVINLAGYEIAARNPVERIAAFLLELKNQPIIMETKRSGASVVLWNPMRQSLTKLMLLGLRSKR